MLLLPIHLSAQTSAAQIWVVGNNDFPGQPGYGNAIIRFENGQAQVTPIDLKMNFESTVAAMPDSAGQILFYTNGCYIADALGDTMPGGTGLNPGEIHDWVCPSSGYTAPFGAMILPIPGSESRYGLFHMGIRYSPERRISYGPFYCTIVDMALNGGKGAAIAKNKILADGKLEPFAAVRHANGRDWWIVVPEYGSNRYHRFLLNPSGPQGLAVAQVGDSLSCRYIGSSAFAPNGTRYARQQHCGMVVMDFDRCSGGFSNPKRLSIPPMAFGGGGVAFSPDGDRVFTSTQLSITSADLTQPNPQLDTVVTVFDAIGTGMGLMQYGPDGRIYIPYLGRSTYLHVLDLPSDQTVIFHQQGFPLPVWNDKALPNLPNFRLGDLHGSPCDSLGITPLREPQPEAAFAVSVSPNPAQSEATLRDLSPESAAQERRWRLYAPAGQVLRSGTLPPGLSEQHIALSSLPAGLYVWEMLRSDGSRAAGKLVVQRQ
ncbi:MAG TPA: T9SS type A sorting domain-containing protein [Saprospiraceae bacterium]|nr:T9SS type A sorting domain-containing protein [Saprospiraceae bacterium]